MKTYGLITLLILMTALGCTKKYGLPRHEAGGESAWPLFRGDASGTASVSGDFNGCLGQIWIHKSSDKAAGPLSIANGHLIYPGTSKKARFYDCLTGKYLGRLKLRGMPQTGLATADTLAFYGIAQRKNRLYCINLISGKHPWHQPVKDALTGSIITGNRLFVGSSEGLLSAYDFSGKLDWSISDSSRLPAGPAYGDGRLFLPTDQNGLLALSADDGHELFRVELGGPLVAAAAFDRVVYVSDMPGNVYAIDPDDGHIIWQVALNGPIWTAPAVLENAVFVAQTGGMVVALEAATGRMLWQQDVGEVIKASPVVVGDFVVVGTMTGQLLTIGVGDGEIVDRTSLDGAISVSPVSDGTRVYVATDKGKIACFGECNEDQRPAHNRPDSQHQSQRSGP